MREPDIGSVPKWRRPIDPVVAEALGVRVDPALGVDTDTAYLLELDS